MGPNCASQPSRCGLPDGTNTGVLAGTTLTARAGGTISTAGTVISNADIRGCLTIDAANVTIRNSRIRCTSGFAVRMPWQANSPVRNLLLENVEIDCGISEATGVAGSNFTARRLSVHGCANGFAADANVTIERSYIWGMQVVNSSHTDGIELSGANPVKIMYNTILNYGPGGTSAIISQTGSQGQPNTIIEGNLLGGGSYTLYCPRAASPGFRAINNRFVRDSYAYGPTDSCRAPYVAELSGNVWDNNNAPL